MPYLNFSQQVKSELVRVQPDHLNCKRAELIALLQSAGALHIGVNGPSLEIKTENAALARKVVSYFRALGQSSTELLVEKETRLRKHNLYRVRMQVDLDQSDLSSTLITNILNKSVPELSEECCRRSYLRGLFLGSGSIQHPEKTYHLEIRFNDLSFAEKVRTFLGQLGFNFGIVERRNEYLLYVKDGESVATFLTMAGAHKALLEMENIRIIKEIKNDVNRVVNCETANLEKTATASANQLKAIELLEENGWLTKLPQGCLEVARARKENPHASYVEIAEILGVGKSAVSYRLKKIEKEAEKITTLRRNKDANEE